MKNEEKLGNWILIALIIGCVLFLLFSCTIPRKAKETEPIGPFHPMTLYQKDGIVEDITLVWGYGHTLSDTLIWDDSCDPGFYKPPPCDHIYVYEAIPVLDEQPDTELIEAIKELQDTDTWSCVCIKCHDLKQCY